MKAGRLLSLSCLVACGAAPAETATHTDFESLFFRVGAIVLEEPDSAPITGIRALAPGLDGGVVVVDRGRSQTRLHGSDGRLQRIIGRFGGGPGEFREPMDARFDRAGRLYVADADGSRITRFHPDFGYDTAYAVPAMGIYEIDWVPEGLLVTTWNELGGPNPWFQIVVDTADGATLARLGPIDSLLWRVPYWRSFNRPLGSGDATLLVTGNYLLYPFTMYDGAGRFIKEFGSPPPSYRPPEELERGAFIGLEGQKKMNDWLRSHTRVSRLDIYRDSLIFAVHAVPDPTPADRSEHLDRTVDIYDRNGEKIWVDIPLPGLRVLRTEQYLYVLETMPPDGPWTIGKYEYRGVS